ncbi:hypothetical protein H2203_002056 [Taxawa tesnikishii (nom. ined.)]|nr:hypothetical protein H2203_002056 [Dothideales sp. JES 119]
MSKTRALRLLDHAMSGPAVDVCSHLVEAAGLKTVFGMFMKKQDNATTEHLLGVFSALLRLLPGESAARIRTLAKFVEKDYEKVSKLMKLRRDYASRRAEKSDEWFSRRLDAGLYCLQTLDVILAWLVAEDDGARKRVVQLLGERDETLAALRSSLEEQLDGVGDLNEDKDTAEMLNALLDFLK